MSIEIRAVTAGSFEFRCRVAGTAGEPVILLHGFPETSDQWSELMLELLGAGYRCLAPDQRGYSLGARPADVDGYSLDKLASDVVALADALGFDRFHLVGHDWGAAVGWVVVRDHAERVLSWAALSVPHLASYGAAFELPEHREKVAYIDDMLVPGKVEQGLSRNGFAQLHEVWANLGQHKVLDYESVLTQPGALTAALNWYRANFAAGARRDKAFAPFDVLTPTLTLWGNRDHAIGRPATVREQDFMRGPYRFVELNAGHWMMHEAGDTCIREIVAHIRSHPTTAYTQGSSRPRTPPTWQP
jgi:pimeloyl-ACP methyl ester carboxylesterase